jgi:hypothetical protein
MMVSLTSRVRTGGCLIVCLLCSCMWKESLTRRCSFIHGFVSCSAALACYDRRKEGCSCACPSTISIDTAIVHGINASMYNCGIGAEAETGGAATTGERAVTSPITWSERFSLRGAEPAFLANELRRYFTASSLRYPSSVL